MQNELILATHTLQKIVRNNSTRIIDVEVISSAAKMADQPKQLPAIASARNASTVEAGQSDLVTERIQNIAPTALKSHPLNSTLYGDEALDPAFVESIKTMGIQVPLIATHDYVVIAGHRRLRGALELGLESVPVIAREFVDALSAEAALVENNRQRIKTNEMLGKEVIKLAEIETLRAKQRQKEGGALKGAKKRSVAAGNGSVRDNVGKQVGLSGPTTQHLMETTKALQELVKSGKDKEAGELRVALNKSVSKGHAVAIQMGALKTTKPTAASALPKEAKATARVPPTAATPKSAPKPRDESPYAQEDDAMEIADIKAFIRWLRVAVRFLEDQDEEISNHDRIKCETLFNNLRDAMMDCDMEA